MIPNSVHYSAMIREYEAEPTPNRLRLVEYLRRRLMFDYLESLPTQRLEWIVQREREADIMQGLKLP